MRCKKEYWPKAVDDSTNFIQITAFYFQEKLCLEKLQKLLARYCIKIAMCPSCRQLRIIRKINKVN